MKTIERKYIFIILLGIIGILIIYGFYQTITYNPAKSPSFIAPPFSSLGTPYDWNIDTSGNFDVILNNMLSSDIEIYKVRGYWGSTETVYEPAQPIVVEAGGKKTLLSSESGLNFGPREEMTSYSIDIELLYNSGRYNHVETGNLKGIVGHSFV